MTTPARVITVPPALRPRRRFVVEPVETDWQTLIDAWFAQQRATAAA